MTAAWPDMTALFAERDRLEQALAAVTAKCAAHLAAVTDRRQTPRSPS